MDALELRALAKGITARCPREAECRKPACVLAQGVIALFETHPELVAAAVDHSFGVGRKEP